MTAGPAGVTLPKLARRTLPAGLTVLALERRSLPLVSLGLYTRAGSHRDPAGKLGLAALTARTMRQGAGGLDARAFVEEIDFLGGRLHAAASLDHLAVEAEFTTDTLDRGLAMFADTVLRPRFAPDIVERERQRVLAEIVQSRDEPDEVAGEAFMAAVHAGHPYGNPPRGRADTVAQLERSDLVAHHLAAVLSGGAVLVAAGDLDAESACDRLTAAIGEHWPSTPAPDPPPPSARPTGRRVVLVHDEGSGQVQYRTGSVGVARNTPRWHALLLANACFGGGFTSRLVQEIRVQRGLTYGVHSSVIAGRAAGPYLVATFTRNEALEELHGVVTAELDRLHGDGLTGEELEAARAYVRGGHLRRMETAGALVGAVAEAELFDLGLDSIPAFESRLQSVTLADAAAAVENAVPRSEELVTVLVGDRRALETTAGRLGDRLTILADDGTAIAGEAAP